VSALSPDELKNETESESLDTEKRSFGFAQDVSETMLQEADDVRLSIARTANRLFAPEPLGFSRETLIDLYGDILQLPARLPDKISDLIKDTRTLGVLGSFLGFFILLGITKFFVDRKKVITYLETLLQPFEKKLPDILNQYISLLLHLMVTLLIPVSYWIVYRVISAFTNLEAPWFLMMGNLIIIWITGAAFLLIIHELFIGKLISIPSQYAQLIHRILKIITLYVIFTLILFHCAEAFNLNPEYLALLKLSLSLTVVFASLNLISRKKAILSLIPKLPYKSYNYFRKSLVRFYTPAMIGTFLTGFLWSFGYRDLSRLIWLKTWALAVSIVIIGLLYHYFSKLLKDRQNARTKQIEASGIFYSGILAALNFTTIIALIYTVMFLLGLFEPLKRLISFPIFIAGGSGVSLWSFIRFMLIIWVFNLFSRILRGYLDYKVFPILNVEIGLAYSINTFLNYILLLLGALIALYSIGLDLRILMVFAGAIGIGIGLGLQSFASNVISGLMLIFGQKIRKGDWIQTGDTLGYVREVTLHVTKVVTRDNVEYLIPNAEMTSKTIINYTLTDPNIRIYIPVGVSYNADPEIVKNILLEQARKYGNLCKNHQPDVWFSEYAESSINFVLLVWIDVRQISEPEVKSDLYFEIFKALAANSIEIPFPQHDIHIQK